MMHIDSWKRKEITLEPIYSGLVAVYRAEKRNYIA